MLGTYLDDSFSYLYSMKFQTIIKVCDKLEQYDWIVLGINEGEKCIPKQRFANGSIQNYKID
jgi:hypothetical protein